MNTALIRRDTLSDTLSWALRFVSAAWQVLTWKRMVYVFLFCSAWGVIETLALSAGLTHLVSWSPPLNGVLSMLFNGFAVMLAVMVADAASPPPLRRWWPYCVAVVVGVMVGTTLFWLFSQHLFKIPSAYQLHGSADGFDTLLFRHSTSRLFLCSLATYFYVSYRWAAQRLAALRAVQIERVKVEKRVLESRLAAMQARVEPQFLLDTLAQVERLHEIDAEAADRMLRELTVYLRAAIPRFDDPASSVATEIRLANAFLNIVGLQSRDRLVLSAGASTIADGARMPAMIMLPLVNHALAHRAERARGDERFEIDLAVHDEQLRLTIRDPGSGFMPDGAGDTVIQRIVERLSALHGAGGRLTLERSPAGAGTEAIIKIPFETVQSDAPA